MTKKKVAMVVGAMALSAVMAVGGTLAYLQSVTETKTNTFSSSKNITTTLTEDKWKTDSGSDYTPGKAIAKNPVMTNDSTNEGIYVAVKLDYVGSDGKMTTYTNFKNYASVQTLQSDGTYADGFNSQWFKAATNADGSEIWVYKAANATDAAAVLAATTSTSAIFDQVVVSYGIKEEWTATSKTTTNTVYKVNADGSLGDVIDTTTTAYDPTVNYVIKDSNGTVLKEAPATLPTFTINVTGFAVQADGTTPAEALTNLVSLVNTKTTVKF